MTERYVVLGVARPRAGWFTEISRWATTAAVPLEFVKCLTLDEVRARIDSGRRWSAVLLDGSLPGVERDFIDAVCQAGAAVLVVADGRSERNWSELGATATLRSQLGRDDLLAALAEHTRPVADASPRPPDPPPVTQSPWRGRLVAVTGPGGTGASTVAGMLAQAMASEVDHLGLVLLADLALDADQAVIHDAGDVVPGLPELVDGHRLGRLDTEEIRALTFATGPRRYQLLLGMRRHRDWTMLRPRAVAAAIDGLCRAYRAVVVDIDADIEGEEETGSTDVEERNILARHAIAGADAVVVVGAPGPVGVHRLARTIRTLLAGGVPAQRLLPVINRAPRAAHRRAEIARALAELCGPESFEMAAPVALPHLRRLDELIRAGARWPDGPCRTLHGAVTATLERPLERAVSTMPARVVPGSLGHFSDLGEIEEDLA